MNRGANAARQPDGILPVALEVVEADENQAVQVENDTSPHTRRPDGSEAGNDTETTDEDWSDDESAPDRPKADADTSEVSTDLVRVYFSQIGKVALLTAEQEVELSEKVEAGLYAEKIYARYTEARKNNQQIIKVEQPETLEDYLGNHALQLYASGVRRDYAVLIREGKDAKNQLLEANLRLVVSIAKRYTGHGMKFLDLIQEGNVGLIRAVEKFDYHKGFKFSTYATWWIRQAITRAMADSGKTIRLPVHLAEQVNKAVRTRRRMEQELEREPTSEELGLELDITPERATELLSYARNPASLDAFVGDDEDSRLGDFVEDIDAPSPETQVEYGNTRDTVEEVLKTLSKRERDVVTLRFGLNGDKPWTLDAIGQMYGLSRERVRQIERETMAKLRDPQRKVHLEGLL